MSEQIIEIPDPVSGANQAKFAAVGNYRYLVSAASNLDGGTLTASAYSKALDEAVALPGVSPVVGYTFESDDPYIIFEVTGGLGNPTVQISAIPIITRDRSA